MLFESLMTRKSLLFKWKKRTLQLQRIPFLNNELPFANISFLTYLNDMIHIIIASPVKEVSEHELGLVHVELSRSQKTEEVVIIVLRMICQFVILNVCPELFKHLILIFTHITHEPIGQFKYIPLVIIQS